MPQEFPPCPDHAGKETRVGRICRDGADRQNVTVADCLACSVWHGGAVPIWKAGRKAPVNRSLPCVHRGQQLRSVVCVLCGGKEGSVPVHACAVHGECTLNRYDAGQREPSCVSCRDRVENLIQIDTPAAILAAPSDTGSPRIVPASSGGVSLKSTLRWAYGVTTTPARRETLLPQTLRSMAAAGFDKSMLFVDGCDDPASYAPLGLSVTCRLPAVGNFANWFLSALAVYLSDPFADMYAMFEDDLILSRGARSFLEVTARSDKQYYSLYTCPVNEKQRVAGWSETRWCTNPDGTLYQKGLGAVGLVFTREVFKTLLSDHGMLEHATDNRINTHSIRGVITAERRGSARVDGAVVAVLNARGVSEMCHTPSIAQHVGDVSTMGHAKFQRSKTFMGENFDMMSVSTSMPEQIVVIIVVFNCCDLVRECLEHLRDFCSIPFRVILVDNASSESLPEVEGVDMTVIRNESNLGWTAAANMGIARAGGQHVLLLNSDCNVGPRCVEKLYEHLMGSDRVAVTAPMTGDGHRGRQSLTPGRRVPHNAITGAQAVSGAAGPHRSHTLAFFCALLHHDAIREIGTLDERPAFASGLGADDEWCHRATRVGWQCLVVDDAFAQHLGSQSFIRNGVDRKQLQDAAVRELQRITH